jgi:hypothetical protein
MAAMMLGILEAVMHTAMIRMFRLKHFYSPGLVTAVFVLLPISLYAFAYVIRHDLVRPLGWLFAFLYMLFGLVVAQQVVIRASGVRYSDFLKNVRAALIRKQEQPHTRSRSRRAVLFLGGVACRCMNDRFGPGTDHRWPPAMRPIVPRIRCPDEGPLVGARLLDWSRTDSFW